MQRSFYGKWIIAACFITFGIAVGLPYYNMPFFYDYYVKTYRWPISDITLGFPLAALLTLWVGPVLVPRFSPRKLVIVGTALTLVSFFGFSRMTGSPGPVRTRSSCRTGTAAIAGWRWESSTWASASSERSGRGSSNLSPRSTAFKPPS
jgi:hypothetical protein